MRFIIIVKATPASEAGVHDERVLTEMGRFNEELVAAGVMLAGEGLHPSSKGARLRFSGAEATVVPGPFSTEGNHLVAGFWIWRCDSLEEALAWAKRCPNPGNEDFELEVRQIYELEDFGAELTPETRASEAALREKLDTKLNS